MEKLMQYVWQHRLWDSRGLTTNDGRRIKVIDPGLLNTDAGPDFFNAKVEIDGEMWAGNVEIHVRASDWARHGHQQDAAYDSVILHVVERDDCPVCRANGEKIPQCVMKCSPHFNESYNELVNFDSVLPCASAISEIPSIAITEWIEALAFERLQSKVKRITELLSSFNGSWEDVCYNTLARNLGFGINNDAFERLARRTPLRLLQKHSDSLFQIEALFFGQAGMLDSKEHLHDEYYQHLCREYSFLANKFSLTPMESSSWKLFRIRPQSFPHRRIATLSQLVHDGFVMFKQIVDTKDIKALRQLFDIKLTGYWATHFSFGNSTASEQKSLSNQAIDIILINTVAPLYYAYSEIIDSYELSDRAIALLESLKPEHNTITRQFEACGIKVDNALVSQALIQLRREYCEARKCLYCRIGHRILSRAAVVDE
ncbi:MAG: DUF2851 family protein [Muribaculaceae bacterium]|nr:DUF2851 family protein [Muribaculaceae bacterium]